MKDGGIVHWAVTSYMFGNIITDGGTEFVICDTIVFIRKDISNFYK